MPHARWMILDIWLLNPSILPEVTVRELRSSVEASGYELAREIDPDALLEDTEAAERAEWADTRSAKCTSFRRQTSGGSWPIFKCRRSSTLRFSYRPATVSCTPTNGLYEKFVSTNPD